MFSEIPLQYDLFTGGLVDTRTAAQKQRERERARPAQLSMFSTHQQVELATPVRPWLNTYPQPPMQLEIQDVRTEEEKYRDLMREAEKLTKPMFGEALTLEPVSSPTTQMETSLPLVQLSRVDLLRFRPDLEEKICALSDDELDWLSHRVGESLQAFYSMMLNVVISTYFEREAKVQMGQNLSPS